MPVARLRRELVEETGPGPSRRNSTLLTSRGKRAAGGGKKPPGHGDWLWHCPGACWEGLRRSKCSSRAELGAHEGQGTGGLHQAGSGVGLHGVCARDGARRIAEPPPKALPRCGVFLGGRGSEPGTASCTTVEHALHAGHELRKAMVPRTRHGVQSRKTPCCGRVRGPGRPRRATCQCRSLALARAHGISGSAQRSFMGWCLLVPVHVPVTAKSCWHLVSDPGMRMGRAQQNLPSAATAIAKDLPLLNLRHKCLET